MNLTDSLSMVNPAEVSKQSYVILDLLQNMKPAVQVQVLACLFLLLLQEFNADPRRELARAEDVMRDADKKLLNDFAAIRDYIRGELL